MPEAACNILHQHVIQGDLTDLQVAALRWRALSKKAKTVQINFRVLYDALRNLEERWEKDMLSPQEVRIIDNLRKSYFLIFCSETFSLYIYIAALSGQSGA